MRKPRLHRMMVSQVSVVTLDRIVMGLLTASLNGELGTVGENLLNGLGEAELCIIAGKLLYEGFPHPLGITGDDHFRQSALNAALFAARLSDCEAEKAGH